LTISNLKDTNQQNSLTYKEELKKLNETISSMNEEKDRLQSIVFSDSRKIDELEKDNSRLILELKRTKEQCEDAGRFLNKELENVSCKILLHS
jgi:predicted RNase H-like nuclease (RuvC/YqgF family)